MNILELATQGPPGPPGPSGTGTGIGGIGSARNFWGQSLAQTAGSTATLASISSGYRVMGFVAHGTGDGYFTIQVNSATVLSGRIRLSAPMLVVILGAGFDVVAGSLVTLRVTNESGSTADYEATLLGI